MIVTTEIEHHSNLVPWQVLAKATGAELRYVRIDEHGELKLDELDEIASAGSVKLLAVGDQSNSLGTINPIRELADWVHGLGGVDRWSTARSRCRTARSTCRRWTCDFLAFSGHKLLRSVRRRRALGAASCSRRCRRS